MPIVNAAYSWAMKHLQDSGFRTYQQHKFKLITKVRDESQDVRLLCPGKPRIPAAAGAAWLCTKTCGAGWQVLAVTHGLRKGFNLYF